MNDHERTDGAHPTGPDPIPADLGAVEPDVAAALAAIRSEFSADAPPPVGAALSEFVDVHLVVDKGDLPVTAASNANGPAVQVAGLPKRRVTFTRLRTRSNKMIEKAGMFMGTLAGKIAIGATVALAAAGGVQAAGVNVPILPGGDDPAIEQADNEVAEPTTTTIAEPEDQVAPEVAPEADTEDPEAAEPDDHDDDTVVTLGVDPTGAVAVETEDAEEIGVDADVDEDSDAACATDESADAAAEPTDPAEEPDTTAVESDDQADQAAADDAGDDCELSQLADDSGEQTGDDVDESDGPESDGAEVSDDHQSDDRAASDGPESDSPESDSPDVSDAPDSEDPTAVVESADHDEPSTTEPDSPDSSDDH